MQNPTNTIEMLEDLFFIQRGYLNANHYVCRSSRPVLIDSGYADDWDATRRLIEAVGVDPAGVALIINTHTHCDHVGGNRAIQERSGCDIALHPIGRHFIATRDDWSTWWRYYDQTAPFFTCTHSLADGACIQVGDHEFTVLFTPGHASDGIVLYHPKERLLISSDTLWENDLAVITIRVEGSAAVFRLRESLDRLATLDVRRVYPGHGAPFDDVSGAMRRARERLDGYLRDRRRIGRDQIKKIIVYTLLMKKAVPVEELFPLLMGTCWYKETVDLYYNGAYRSIYEDVVNGFLRSGVIRQANQTFMTTVRP